MKTMYPDARTIAHPECTEQLLNHADHIGSTSSLIQYVKNHNSQEFIVLTEPGIIHQMHKVSPDSIFYEVPSLNEGGCVTCSQCPYMRLNSIEKIYACMVQQAPIIHLDQTIMSQARVALDRMLNI